MQCYNMSCSILKIPLGRLNKACSCSVKESFVSCCCASSDSICNSEVPDFCLFIEVLPSLHSTEGLLLLHHVSQEQSLEFRQSVVEQALFFFGMTFTSSCRPLQAISRTHPFFFLVSSCYTSSHCNTGYELTSTRSISMSCVV